MHSIKEIDIKRDEGSVMVIIEQNIKVATETMKAAKKDRICPSIAKVSVLVGGL